MNDEVRDELSDGSEDLVAGLQEEVERLEGELEARDDHIMELETELQDLRNASVSVDEAPAPVGDEGLQALANTVRTAMRNGHPDAQTHLDNLLNSLGAR